MLAPMRTRGTGKMMAAQVMFCIAVLAQQQPNRVEFEAVSIKAADPSTPAHMAQQTPGGYRGRNIRLFELIMGAWGLNRDQIVGGPNWLETAGWDIDARFPTGVVPSQSPQMTQTMLADRFQLMTHRETRILPVYTLTVAKGGLKLQKGDGTGGMSAGPRMIRYRSATIGELAGQLSGYLGRQVLDKTGVDGQFAITLSFAPVDVGGGDATSTDPAPSIFQALQEQAGLKLEADRGPVEVVVIDRAEKPTPN